jgi:hypothetical protein
MSAVGLRLLLVEARVASTRVVGLVVVERVFPRAEIGVEMWSFGALEGAIVLFQGIVEYLVVAKTVQQRLRLMWTNMPGEMFALMLDDDRAPLKTLMLLTSDVKWMSRPAVVDHLKHGRVVDSLLFQLVRIAVEAHHRNAFALPYSPIIWITKGAKLSVLYDVAIMILRTCVGGVESEPLVTVYPWCTVRSQRVRS